MYEMWTVNSTTSRGPCRACDRMFEPNFALPEIAGPP